MIGMIHSDGLILPYLLCSSGRLIPESFGWPVMCVIGKRWEDHPVCDRDVCVMVPYRLMNMGSWAEPFRNQ